MKYFSRIAKSCQISFIHQSLTHLSLCFALCFYSVWALAQSNNKNYRIEMIIYSQLNPQSIQAEKWPSINNQIQVPDHFTNITLTKDGATQETDDTTLALIKPNELKLIPVGKALENKLHAHILAHFGWQQDFSKQEKSEIYLHSAPEADQAMNGLISVSLNRYFNTSFHFVFSQPIKKIKALSIDTNHLSNIIGDNAYFDLKQHRRMRSNELNYIDHPLYGIIVKISPINEPGLSIKGTQ